MTDLSQEATLWSQLDRPTLLVGNPDSLLEKFPSMAGQLEACKALTICGTLETEDPAADLAERVAKTGAQRLWIIGGDGTINLVAECAIRFNLTVPCWLTPAGTANDLVRSISENIGRSQQAELLALSASQELPAQATPRIGTNDRTSSLDSSPSDSPSGLSTFLSTGLSGSDTDRAELASPLDIDLMRISLDDGLRIKACANMLTLGTSARNTQHVTSEIKARWGALAYLTQAWRAMTDLEPFTMRLGVGASQSITAKDVLNVFIANGAYCGGGHRVAPQAELNDGRFNVILLRSGTTSELAHLTAAFLAGSHLDHELIEHFTTHRLSIEFDSDSLITLDGEASSAKKLVVQSIPRALSLQLVGV